MNYEETKKKVLEKYPDLKGMGNTKMIVYAYRFREEQLKEYRVRKTTELANGRCLEPGMRFEFGPNYKDIKVSKDLPYVDLTDECVVCRELKESIAICSDCWEKIRKCLELKGKSHRGGWNGWGVEMNLDLGPLVKLLKENNQL